MADDFSFGDFIFAPPPPPLQPTSNTSDAFWGDVFVTSNSAHPIDPAQFKAQKSNGNGNGGLLLSDLNGWFDPAQLKGNDDKKDDGFGLNFSGLGSDLIFDNYKKGSDKKEISNDNNNKKMDEDEYDDWEFMGAFSGNGNGNVHQENIKSGVVVNGLNEELVAKSNQDKQAGQDAFSNINPGSISYAHPSNDFFAALNGNGIVANHQSSEMDFGFKSSPNTTNGFVWDPFPIVENTGNGIGISARSIDEDDGFDEFGDFVDASQVVSKDQGPVVTQLNLAEPQLPNGGVQEKQTQTGLPRGAIPLSFFGEDTEESSDSLDIQNEVAHLPTLSPVNSFSGQSAALSPGNSFSGQGASTSIQDLISDLYSQAQQTSTNTMEKSAENGVQFPSNVAVTALDEDEDWDDDSWEFKGALSQNVLGEQLCTVSPEYMAQKESEICSELQTYAEFYNQLRGTLCFLLSCQLDEKKKDQCSDAVTGKGEKAETFDDEIQEAFKLLEERAISKELLPKEFDRYHCLNNFVEALQGPKLNMIESDFSLGKRLQLATNDWRVAAELLRHAISMQKVLSLGSADDQSLYASTWSKILNVCIKELRCGSLIWRRALEQNVQHQILSDSRGQQFFQALGEIYKVVAILGLSAKVYKPWILQSVTGSSQIFSILDECDALWSNPGLEEAIQKLSDVTFGRSETAKSTIDSIKNIREIDIFTMHDCVSNQQTSHCRVSLLPLEMFNDLKTATWGEETYFLNIANLWANLINCNPPHLPQLKIK